MNPHASRPHAGTDGIYVAIIRGDGNLRAVARLPADRLDLDDTVVNLGHFEFKKASEQTRMGAGNVHLRPFRRLPDLGDVHLQTGAGGVLLSGHLLRWRHDRFHLAQIDHDAPVLVALHDTGHDVAFPVRELLVYQGPFGLADTLNDHLLGRLRGDPSEIFRRHLDLDDVVELVIGIDGLRVFERDLVRFIEHLVDYVFAGKDANFAGALVQVDAHVERVAVMPLIGRDNCRLDRLEEDLLRDAPFFFQFV